jgi:hypothetical protein
MEYTSSPLLFLSDVAAPRILFLGFAEQYPIELLGHALKIHRAKPDPSDHGAA